MSACRKDRHVSEFVYHSDSIVLDEWPECGFPCGECKYKSRMDQQYTDRSSTQPFVSEPAEQRDRRSQWKRLGCLQHKKGHWIEHTQLLQAGEEQPICLLQAVVKSYCLLQAGEVTTRAAHDQ